mmetsp:Transcript_10519/g.21630  ORF Transcript_10519/g.21630 Transcript_10519/m.21630 type:complete len:391 (-) Transcript_10519:397-1569(-)
MSPPKPPTSTTSSSSSSMSMSSSQSSSQSLSQPSSQSSSQTLSQTLSQPATQPATQMSTQISTQISTYTNSLLQYYTKVAPTKFQLEHSSKSMQGDDDITTYDVTTYASMRCKEIVSRYVQTTQEDDKGRTYIRDNTDVLKRELKKLYGVEWDCPPMIPMIPSPILPTPPLPTSSPSESLPSSPPKKTTTTTSQPYSAEDTNRYLQSLLTSKITSLKTTTKQAVKGVMEEKWEREREGMKREIEILRERDRVWRVVFMEGGASGLLNLGIEVPSSANDFDVKPQCNNVDDNDNVKDDTMALIASQSRVISKLKSRVEEREGMRDMVREMEVKIEQKDKVYRKMKEKVEALRSAIDERDRKIGMATAREVEFKDVVKGLEREIEDREGLGF